MFVLYLWVKILPGFILMLSRYLSSVIQLNHRSVTDGHAFLNADENAICSSSR